MGIEQQKAAERLGVSQSYLSLLENGKRKISRKFAEKVARVFPLSPENLPTVDEWDELRRLNNSRLAEMLGTLGYPGFAHLKKSKMENPGVVLFFALRNENLESRIVEALPWLIFMFPQLDWDKLTRYAKLYDFQNKLGFIVCLARQLAQKHGQKSNVGLLLSVEHQLEKSRLFREDFFAKTTFVERAFLEHNRSSEAKFWRVLSDLSVRNLNYA